MTKGAYTLQIRKQRGEILELSGSSFPLLLTPGLQSWHGTTHTQSVPYPSQLILFGNAHRGIHRGMPSACLNQVSLKSDITLYN